MSRRRESPVGKKDLQESFQQARAEAGKRDERSFLLLVLVLVLLLCCCFLSTRHIGIAENRIRTGSTDRKGKILANWKTGNGELAHAGRRHYTALRPHARRP